jgi:hypothetical protein
MLDSKYVNNTESVYVGRKICTTKVESWALKAESTTPNPNAFCIAFPISPMSTPAELT